MKPEPIEMLRFEQIKALRLMQDKWLGHRSKWRIRHGENCYLEFNYYTWMVPSDDLSFRLLKEYGI